MSLNVRRNLYAFWKGLSFRPDTDGFTDEAKAELLLRTGTLTGWLGSAKQVRARRRWRRILSAKAPLFLRR